MRAANRHSRRIQRIVAAQVTDDPGGNALSYGIGSAEKDLPVFGNCYEPRFDDDRRGRPGYGMAKAMGAEGVIAAHVVGRAVAVLRQTGEQGIGTLHGIEEHPRSCG